MSKKYVEHVELTKKTDGKDRYLYPKNNIDGISVDSEYTGKNNDSTLGIYLPTIESETSNKMSRDPFGIFRLDDITVSDDMYRDLIDNETDFNESSLALADNTSTAFAIRYVGDITLENTSINAIMGISN